MDGPNIFTERGISDEVRDARGYLWYSPDDPDPEKRFLSAQFESWADTTPRERRFINKVVRQAPGHVMFRSPPPRMDLPPIHPELRPDIKYGVKTKGPHYHYHGTHILTGGELEDWAREKGYLKKWLKRIGTGEEPFDRAGIVGWGKDVVKWFDVGTPNTMARHINKKPKFPGDHRMAPDGTKLDLGVNPDAPHRHQPFAKYAFGLEPKIKVERTYRHDHVEDHESQRHIDRDHGGIDQVGRHEHKTGKMISVRDPSKPRTAARIDVHPMAVEKILADSVVFFVLEGELKADAVLSADGAVFSVPSVTLWDSCVELDRFLSAYIIGEEGRPKMLVVVPDADWYTNWMVASQARQVQARLHQLGVLNAYIAAPPFELNLKGVDDYLAAGLKLADLDVIDYEPPPGLDEYVRTHPNASKIQRRDCRDRDAQALKTLVGYADPETGEVAGSYETIARLLGMKGGGKAAWRAVQSLGERGALVTTYGILDNEPRPNAPPSVLNRSHELTWQPPKPPRHVRKFNDEEGPSPIFTLIPELRPTSQHKRLADVIAAHHIEGELPCWMNERSTPRSIT